ncbi:MAG: hypothetical protein CM15mP119_0010 [Alphaproteobacteria bacterium]|nr:MAG: hypothetical protein CM15mP119_0010 [Alphaproteobacteria bacterium]
MPCPSETNQVGAIIEHLTKLTVFWKSGPPTVYLNRPSSTPPLLPYHFLGFAQKGVKNSNIILQAENHQKDPAGQQRGYHSAPPRLVVCHPKFLYSAKTIFTETAQPIKKGFCFGVSARYSGSSFFAAILLQNPFGYESRLKINP